MSVSFRNTDLKSARFTTSVHFIVSAISVCDESLITVNGGA